MKKAASANSRYAWRRGKGDGAVCDAARSYVRGGLAVGGPGGGVVILGDDGDGRSGEEGGRRSGTNRRESRASSVPQVSLGLAHVDDGRASATTKGTTKQSNVSWMLAE
jgi:hypothetical protein